MKMMNTATSMGREDDILKGEKKGILNVIKTMLEGKQFDGNS